MFRGLGSRTARTLLLAGLVALAAAPGARAVQPIGGAQGTVSSATSVGAFAVAPYLTWSADGDLMTAVTVTNTLSSGIFLDLLFVDGEPDGAWNSPSLPDCFLSPRETTVFRFTPDGTSTVVEGECSTVVFDPYQLAFPQLNGLNQPFHTVLDDSQAGFIGILATSSTAANCGLPNLPCSKKVNAMGDPILGDQNSIVADWTMVDFAAGTVYSAEAHHFQVGGGGADGDGLLTFGGAMGNFGAIPLTQATNLILPDCEDRLDPATCDVDVELILVPLDGRIFERPAQAVNLEVWNDDEVSVDRQHHYECFDVVRLAEVDSRFLADNHCLVTDGFDTAAAGCVGHLDVTNLPSYGSLLHDTLNGDGNLVRNSATIGWVIHRFRPDNGLATRPDGELLNLRGLMGNAATARILVSGLDPVTPLLGDDRVVLDATSLLP